MSAIRRRYVSGRSVIVPGNADGAPRARSRAAGSRTASGAELAGQALARGARDGRVGLEREVRAVLLDAAGRQDRQAGARERRPCVAPGHRSEAVRHRVGSPHRDRSRGVRPPSRQGRGGLAERGRHLADVVHREAERRRAEADRRRDAAAGMATATQRPSSSCSRSSRA